MRESHFYKHRYFGTILLPVYRLFDKTLILFENFFEQCEAFLATVWFFIYARLSNVTWELILAFEALNGVGALIDYAELQL